MKFIEKYKSPSFDIRKKGTFLSYIILHYTAIKDYNEALSHLCKKENKVSSHFLINKSGEIFYLVDIMNRAWHAGKSYWRGVTDINSESIGIEIDNSGHYLDFENYTLKQINALIKLLKYICKKFSINNQNIIGHSDIAPYRKLDPGIKFPWTKLNSVNLSFLPKKISLINKKYLDNYLYAKLGSKNEIVRSLYMLEKIGYDVRKAKKIKKITFL